MVGEGDAKEFTGPAEVGDDLELIEEAGGKAVSPDPVTSDVEGIVAGNPWGDEGVGRGIGVGPEEAGREQWGERAEEGTDLIEVAGVDALLEADLMAFLRGDEEGIVGGGGDQFPGGGALDESDLDLAPESVGAELDFCEDPPTGIRGGAGEDEIEIESVTFDIGDHAIGASGVDFAGGFEDGGNPAELTDILALMGKAEGGRIGGVEDALDDGVEGDLGFELATGAVFVVPEETGHGDPEGDDGAGDEVSEHGKDQRGGITRDWPTLRRLESTPGLAAWMAWRLTLCFRAMAPRESPDWTL